MMRELKATLRNLTPHPITFIDANDRFWEIFPEPVPARVGEKRIALGWVIDGTMRVPISRKAWDRDNATGIPPKDTGLLYIVSTVVADAFPERDDFLVPDQILRDQSGQVTGCKGLAQMWPASNQVAREYLEKARDYVTRPAATKSGIGEPVS